MSALGIIPDNDPYQSLRIRRFLTAALVYGIAVGLLGVYTWDGLMEIGEWASSTLAIVLVNLLIYGVLRSGRNERLPDPSLTAVQMFAACALMGLAAFQVDTARGALLPVLMALLMFGAFRLRMGAFLSLGLFGVLCQALAVIALWTARPDELDLRVEALQLLALAAVVPCGGFFVGYVGQLRRQLRARQVDLQRANETVHELEVQDGLTGVNNRMSIVRFVDEERARADRLDLPLSLAILDLDHMKAINRDHGHDIGDRVLERAARTLSNAVRTVDGVGRYGGEEFLVVMPDTDAESALRSTERLRVSMRDCRLDDLGVGPPLPVSAGVAQYSGSESSWTLIERARRSADQALEAGGDRSVGPAALRD